MNWFPVPVVARQPEWFTLPSVLGIRQRYTGRTPDFTVPGRSVTYRNNKLGGESKRATRMQQFGGVSILLLFQVP
jgi:hypothetical protein